MIQRRIAGFNVDIESLIVFIVKLIALIVYISLAAGIHRGRPRLSPFIFAGIVVIIIAASMFFMLRQGILHVRPILIIFAILMDLAILVCAFTAAYYTFGGLRGGIPKIQTHIDALYFTMTILSTVGFGDVVAVSQQAKLLVTVQMTLDFSYLGVVISIAFTLIATSILRAAESANRPSGGRKVEGDQD